MSCLDHQGHSGIDGMASHMLGTQVDFKGGSFGEPAAIGHAAVPTKTLRLTLLLLNICGTSISLLKFMICESKPSTHGGFVRLPKMEVTLKSFKNSTFFGTPQVASSHNHGPKAIGTGGPGPGLLLWKKLLLSPPHVLQVPVPRSGMVKLPGC